MQNSTVDVLLILMLIVQCCILDLMNHYSFSTTTGWNVEAGDFETDTVCYGPCGDETLHAVFVTGKGYGYIVCATCETERDWNAEEFYGDF